MVRYVWLCVVLFFFFKQKTAYEMRISDWSSDVCSSDLPAVSLGQHLIPQPAGQICYRPGIAMSAADSWEVKMVGRGAHGSQPQNSIDPVVMASATVMRLQTVVSREVAMADNAVVTVGTIQSGFNENVTPDEALLRLNIRTFQDAVRSP